MSSLRSVCFDTKGEACVACGTTEDLDVHFRNGDRSDHHIDNLVPMCTDCRTAVHNGQDGYEEWTAQLDTPALEPVTEREHDTFYLDGDVRDELERIYRRISLSILEETGVDIDDQQIGGRNRYFRPLALLLGARELAAMAPDEVRDAIEQEPLVDDLPAAGRPELDPPRQ